MPCIYVCIMERLRTKQLFSILARRKIFQFMDRVRTEFLFLMLATRKIFQFSYTSISCRKESSSNSIGDGPTEALSHVIVGNKRSHDCIDVSNSNVPPLPVMLSASQYFYQTFGIQIAKQYSHYRIVSTTSDHANIFLGQIIIPIQNLAITQCTLRCHFDVIDSNVLKAYLLRRKHTNT
jgi:hypothetical protein